MEMFLYGAIGVVCAVGGSYLLSRAISLGYFRTRNEFDRAEREAMRRWMEQHEQDSESLISAHKERQKEKS